MKKDFPIIPSPLCGKEFLKKELLERTLAECMEIGLTYERGEGGKEVIDLLLAPAVIPEYKAEYIYRTCRILEGLFLRILSLRSRIREIAEALPLDPDEEEYLFKFGPGGDPPGPVVTRWDAGLQVDGDMEEDLKFFEVNAVAVGGIHYGFACENVFLSLVSSIPLLSEARAALSPNPDTRMLFLETCLEHSRKLGDSEFSIAWLEDRNWEEGITEGPSIVQFLRGSGIRAFLCDPADLTVGSGGIFYGHQPVKIVYRNMELRDIIEIDKERGPLHALRRAFKEDRVISSIQAECDHKSMFEIFTDDRFSHFFEPGERAILGKHIPWTRMVKEARVRNREGRVVDLPGFILGDKDAFVIKPNRACGGEDVTIGRYATASQWEGTVQKAFGDPPGSWIVQDYVEASTIHAVTLKGADRDPSPFFTTYGFIATPFGMGVLGRASSDPVVNVSRGGGVMAVLRSGARGDGPVSPG